MANKKSTSLVLYDWNVGKQIKKFIEESTNYTLNAVSEKVNLVQSAFHAKLNKSYYGDVYDLMEVSKALNHDFFAYGTMILRNGGVTSDTYYSKSEYEKLKNELEETIKERDRYSFIVDQLRSKKL